LITRRGYAFAGKFPINFTLAKQRPGPPTIDGHLADWADIPAMAMKGKEWLVRSPERCKSINDLSANIRYAWDNQNLYFACEVSENVYVQPFTGWDTWKADCVQLAFDLDTGKEIKPTGNALADKNQQVRYTEIDLALTARGAEAYRTVTFNPETLGAGRISSKDLKLAVTKKKGPNGVILEYEAAIPWRTIGAETAPVAGSRIGIAGTVNHADDPQQADPTALGWFTLKDPKKFGGLFLQPSGNGAASPAADHPAVRVTYSGILGQSQAPELEALPFVGAIGVAADAEKRLWIADGSDRLFVFQRTVAERWQMMKTVKLPTSVFALRWDGEALFLGGNDGKIYKLDPRAKEWAATAVFTFTPGPFAVAPTGLHRGWAARGKAFFLDADAVKVANPTGAAEVVLTLPRPKGAEWTYCSVMLEPLSGDLLIGTRYPELKVHRFDAKGVAVTRNGWPRANIQPGLLETIAGSIWAGGNGDVTRIPVMAGGKDAMHLQTEWCSCYVNGLAPDPYDGYWLSSSQGAVHFDRLGQPSGHRLGGISGVSGLGIAPDGSLLATVENGQRWLRLGTDDDADGPLRSNANEPWRTGGGWAHRACAFAWDGASFLVLDEVGKQLWHFDPQHTASDEKSWIELTEKNSLAAPRALAVGNAQFWVLDQDHLLVGRQPNYAALETVTLPEGIKPQEISRLALRDDSTLIVATEKQVRAYTMGADGKYVTAWSSPDRFARIVSAAASAEWVVVADAESPNIQILSAQSGQRIATVTAESVPGGMKPRVLAVWRKWLLAVDAQGSRILRFRCDTPEPLR